MVTLCLDTSHIFLVEALIEGDKIISSVQKECWKHQSEEVFPTFIDMMKEANLTAQDIDQIVVSIGPGSYTGVRIALTIAKVFASTQKIPLYTIDTLQLYAGNKDCRVVLDARGKRVYTALFEKGQCVEEAHIETIEELKEKKEDILYIGDGHLFDKEDCWPNLCENFLLTKSLWKKEEEIHLVTPNYLKAQEAYMVKK